MSPCDCGASGYTIGQQECPDCSGSGKIGCAACRDRVWTLRDEAKRLQLRDVGRGVYAGIETYEAIALRFADECASADAQRA